MNVSHPGCPGSRDVERICFSSVVSKASIPSWCLNTTNAVVCDVNENVFICSYVVCTYANYCHVVSMQGVPWSFSALKYR